MIGRRIYGPVGHAVDILATVGTLFGVATSLGLGAMQINAGIARLTAIPQDPMVQVTIIVIAVSPEALVFILGAAGEHLGLLIYPAGLPAEARIVCLYRDEALMLPGADTTLESGDEVILIAHRDRLDQLTERWGNGRGASGKREA